MWQFRIGAFISLCSVVWIASLFGPLHSWSGHLIFLPALAVLGVSHTLAMASYVERGNGGLRKLWAGCVCGTLDALLALGFLFLFSSLIEFGSKDAVRKTIAVVALCVPFVLPPFISPRIVSILLVKKGDESAGVSHKH